MIGSLGWQELLIILVILALLFGANRVAGLGGALGRGIREFRSEARNDDRVDTDVNTSTTASSEQTESNTTTTSNSSTNPPKA